MNSVQFKFASDPVVVPPKVIEVSTKVENAIQLLIRKGLWKLEIVKVICSQDKFSMLEAKLLVEEIAKRIGHKI